MKKRIGILGCTGSIGRQTAEVIRQNRDKYEITLLANKSDLEGLNRLAKEFSEAKTYFNSPLIDESQTYANCDLVINGIVGLDGLKPSIAVIRSQSQLASANKESIICGGNLLNAELKLFNKRIIPIDSEHSTIFQCLVGEDKESVEKIILTASGGAFRDYSEERLKTASAKDALNHPTWIMGKKVTIDCATLMNKGMEIIEARHLFGIRDIDVVQHRESIVHSFVKFKDGNLKACLSSPDMRLPIQYAITYPQRIETKIKELDIFNMNLSFQKPDYRLFPCLDIAKSIKSDEEATVMNAANEIAVKYYLENKIGFYDISTLIEKALNKFIDAKIKTFEDIFDIDKKVKEYINLKEIKRR